MGYKNSSLLCLALFLAVSSSIHAFDITKLLGQYPEYATFNKYLTETKLADQINTRNTITVLVVNDAALSTLSGKSEQVIKATLGTHVILDFFDERKLMEAMGSGQQLTTLFQASGLAVNQQGFIKVALIGEGGIAFGSAVSGAPIDAELMKTVVSQPYNISILQVTKTIVVPGLDAQTSTPSTPSSNAQSPPVAAKAPVASDKAPATMTTQTAKAPAQAAQAPTQSAKAPAQAAQAPAQSAKAPAQAAKAPAQSAKAPAQAAQAPAQSATAPAPAKVAQSPPPTEEVSTPAEAPTTTAEAPTTTAEAPATTAEAPATTAEAPVEAVSPGPAAVEGQAADATTPSSSTRIQIGFVGAVMAFASFLVAM